ncbi:hypothetical protein [Natroniella sp. ANB-PHB2]|uniref:hypothetical protein n=1 Tax=Natroniella sp. ANB-PHB2 TaxID=3384444 RepID=UPI0038D4B8FD
MKIVLKVAIDNHSKRKGYLLKQVEVKGFTILFYNILAVNAFKPRGISPLGFCLSHRRNI